MSEDMKLSEQLRRDHECGDFGRALEGYAERAEALETQLEEARAEFRRINVHDPELMEKVRGYVNAEHGLVVDMEDGTGRTGLYVETGFLRNLLDQLAARDAEAEGLRAERDAALQRAEKAEAAHLHTIDQRDSAEDALSDAFRLVTGRGPEWSNLFGYDNALDEMTERLDRDKSALAAARKALDTAWAAMCERRGYSDAWEWKYGTTWDEEDAEVSAALERINGEGHAEEI